MARSLIFFLCYVDFPGYRVYRQTVLIVSVMCIALFLVFGLNYIEE